MSKQKWKAWFITTLVLFAIVRTVQSCNNKDEIIEPDHVKPKTIQLEKTILKKPTKPTKKVIKKTSPKPKKAKAFVQPNKKVSKNSIFKNKTENVYFKVKNGLALVGGDILIGQVKKDKETEGKVFEKNLEKTKLWPTNAIAYGITQNISPKMKLHITDAIKYFNENTNLEFYPLEQGYDSDAIVFENREEAPCSSYVGRIGGYQPIFVNDKSCGKQEVMHEIMHALGFVHEQQREERDEKIKILWDNIPEDVQHNFALLPDSLIHPYSGSVFDIDFKSIMMYPENAFATSGLKSMESKTSQEISPTKQGLSPIDIERLNYLYGN